MNRPDDNIRWRLLWPTIEASDPVSSATCEKMAISLIFSLDRNRPLSSSHTFFDSWVFSQASADSGELAAEPCAVGAAAPNCSSRGVEDGACA